MTAIAKKNSTPTIKERLSGDGFKSAISEILPGHVTPDRMARAALTALTRTPKLAQCDQASFFKCMMDLSQWGLEPDGRRAHLIPFENRKRGVTECQLIVDYKGLVELAYRTGIVSKIHADVVHAGDWFEYNLGEVEKHIPHFLRTDEGKPDSAGDVIAAYCIVTLKDGASKTELLSFADVESIRNRSRAGNAGPWKTDWCEMAKKTAFRRVSKWIPLSAELRDAIDRDDDKVATEPASPPKARTASEFAEILSAPQPEPEPQQEASEPPPLFDGDDTGPAYAAYEASIQTADSNAELDELLVAIDDDKGLSKAEKNRLAELVKSKK